MALLTPEQQQASKGLVNFLGYLLAVAVMIALACKFVLSGYPPLIAWLEPFNELVIILGAAAVGIVIYANNPLIK